MAPQKRDQLNGAQKTGIFKWDPRRWSLAFLSQFCNTGLTALHRPRPQIHSSICTNPFCNFDRYVCLSCQSTECTGSPGQVGRAWCGWTATHKYSSSFHVIAGAQNASRSYCEQVMSMWDEQANKLTSQAAAKSS